MEINQEIRNFFNQSYIEDLINNGEMDEVFGEFINNYLPTRGDFIIATRELLQQFYNIINNSGIKYQTGPNIRAFKFLLKYMGRKVSYMTSNDTKYGLIIGIAPTEFKQYMNDRLRFTRSWYIIMFDGGTEKTTTGHYLELV